MSDRKHISIFERIKGLVKVRGVQYLGFVIFYLTYVEMCSGSGVIFTVLLIVIADELDSRSLGSGFRERGLLSQGILRSRTDPPERLRGFLIAYPAFCRGFRLRSLGYMLRFVVSARAANMMLVRCTSNVPIS